MSDQDTTTVGIGANGLLYICAHADRHQTNVYIPCQDCGPAKFTNIDGEPVELSDKALQRIGRGIRKYFATDNAPNEFQDWGPRYMIRRPCPPLAGNPEYLYWDRHLCSWLQKRELGTVYSKEERDANPKLPPGGEWLLLSPGCPECGGTNGHTDPFCPLLKLSESLKDIPFALPVRIAKHQDARSDLRFTLMDADGVTVIGTTTQHAADWLFDLINEQAKAVQS